MKHYNPYIKPDRDSFSYTLKSHSDSKSYISKIAFINSAVPILFKKVFYVEFKEGENIKRGYYQDYNNYLGNIYYKCYLKEDNVNFITNGKITSLNPANLYYSYIKIIKDNQNPQLEEQIMIFKFGFKIKQKIEEYFIKQKIDGYSNSQIFNNIFELNVRYASIYLNFDSCHFLEEKLTLIDNSLDLNNEIKFKVFMSKQLERKEKLKKIEINENLY